MSLSSRAGLPLFGQGATSSSRSCAASRGPQRVHETRRTAQTLPSRRLHNADSRPSTSIPLPRPARPVPQDYRHLISHRREPFRLHFPGLPPFVASSPPQRLNSSASASRSPAPRRRAGLTYSISGSISSIGPGNFVATPRSIEAPHDFDVHLRHRHAVFRSRSATAPRGLLFMPSDTRPLLSASQRFGPPPVGARRLCSDPRRGRARSRPGRRRSARRRPRRCSPRGGAASWCRGSGRSTASGRGARRARSAPALRPSARRRCASSSTNARLALARLGVEARDACCGSRSSRRSWSRRSSR